jgi:serine/threonine-protein kinase RsbW
VKRSTALAAANAMRFTIPSDFAASREVQDSIIAEVERLAYCESAMFAIRLGLEEAIVNAIKHGNKFDLAKKVYVQAEISAAVAKITVEDEGPGFDRCEVPDPRADANLEKCSGRGILLIESYMHGVEWGNRGRRITMMRRNEPDTDLAHRFCV